MLPRATTSSSSFEAAQANVARAGLRQGDPPDTLTALTVNVDDAETRGLLADWGAAQPAVSSPCSSRRFARLTTGDRVHPHLRRERPGDVVSVFIPEYVVGHWWEHLLQQQSALRLKGRLLFSPV